MIGDDVMWVCLDCGLIFNEPKHYVETHGLHCGPYEEWDGCPKCSGACTEAYECDCCGEFIVDDYIKTKDGYRYCEDCYCQVELGSEN